MTAGAKMGASAVAKTLRAAYRYATMKSRGRRLSKVGTNDMSTDKEEGRNTPTPVDEFWAGFRARRTILQMLFYSTRNSSRDAWAFHLRLEKSNAPRETALSGPLASIFHSFDKTIAEQTAQDAAWAFMLIADYALQRLGDAIKPVDTRGLGPVLATGVRLSACVWALANQARHLHEWMQTPSERLEENPSVKIIRALKHDPLNPNVAREVIAALPYEAYVDFEEGIFAIADDARQKLAEQ